MMKKYYCWKCKKIVPFFDEEEWPLIESLLSKRISEIKEYRKSKGGDLGTAFKAQKSITAIELEKKSEVEVTNYNAVYHHRLSVWGPECKRCGHLLRTKDAKFCAKCGEKYNVNIKNI